MQGEMPDAIDRFMAIIDTKANCEADELQTQTSGVKRGLREVAIASV